MTIFSRNRNDIKNENDVRQIVDDFYLKALKDELLGPIFDKFIYNFDNHLITINTFWNSVLFRTAEYKGPIHFKHLILPINENHVDRWLFLFEETIDNHFRGSRASKMKRKAKLIGKVMLKKKQ